jgi:thymidylate synthase (FAD)
MLEFHDMTVKFVCDRGVSHEIVRHRLASYAQESTRYCNYSRLKFGRQITFVIPQWLNLSEGEYDVTRILQAGTGKPESRLWLNAMYEIESGYLNLIDMGWSAQKARSVLPNSLKTEIVMKANLREWRHFFTLRCSKAAHPQMRELAIPLLKQFRKRIPLIFDDITY